MVIILSLSVARTAISETREEGKAYLEVSPELMSSISKYSPCVSTDTFMEVQEYAEMRVTCKWSASQWESFNWIVRKESNWNHLAANPRSSATGIGQFLDSTWATVGYTKTYDPHIQVDATIAYIKKVYGNPSAAKMHHLQHNWY
jgi:hypothetical protein